MDIKKQESGKRLRLTICLLVFPMLFYSCGDKCQDQFRAVGSIRLAVTYAYLKPNDSFYHSVIPDWVSPDSIVVTDLKTAIPATFTIEPDNNLGSLSIWDFRYNKTPHYIKIKFYEEGNGAPMASSYSIQLGSLRTDTVYVGYNSQSNRCGKYIVNVGFKLNNNDFKYAVIDETAIYTEILLQ